MGNLGHIIGEHVPQEAQGSKLVFASFFSPPSVWHKFFFTMAELRVFPNYADLSRQFHGQTFERPALAQYPSLMHNKEIRYCSNCHNETTMSVVYCSHSDTSYCGECDQVLHANPEYSHHKRMTMRPVPKNLIAKRQRVNACRCKAKDRCLKKCACFALGLWCGEDC